MTKAGNALALALCAILTANTAGAATAGATPSPEANPSNKNANNDNNNPYQAIVERNVFGLKPPPPPAPPPEQPKPPVNITLTGITTLFGKKRCFITLMSAPKAGVPAAPESRMLSEGQRDGNIEIVSIDEVGGVVNLKEGDSPLTISFKENGVKGGPAPAANTAAVAPMGNHPGGFQPSPFTPTPGQKTIPGRPLRIPTQGQTGGQTGTGVPGGPQYLNGGAAMGQPQLNEQPPIDHETGALLIEAERLRLQDQGNPLANAMPTTRLTPAGAPGTLEDPNANQGANPGNTGSRAPTLPIPPGGPRTFRP